MGNSVKNNNNVSNAPVVSYCVRCGSKVGADDIFCFKCGAKIERDDAVPKIEVKAKENTVSQYAQPKKKTANGVATNVWKSIKSLFSKKPIKIVLAVVLSIAIAVTVILNCFHKTFVGRNKISCGDGFAIAIQADGTVVATGHYYSGQCDVLHWKDIVDVTAGYRITLGIKSDGTVVSAGNNAVGEGDVLDWRDIVSVATGGTAELDYNSDGMPIMAGDAHTIGLKSDGTVIATGDNGYGQCGVYDWSNIVAVSTGCRHTVGLKSDGTVVAVGSNSDGQCDVSDWNDVVAISAGAYHTIGLKSDGTVLFAGDNDNNQCNVEDWTDIEAVSAGNVNTVGVKSDGTVISTENYISLLDKVELNVSGWNLH